MKGLFDAKRGEKLDRNILRMLRQRQLSMNQIKLNLINAVPWKDFEGVRQKVAIMLLFIATNQLTVCRWLKQFCSWEWTQVQEKS